MDSHHKHEETLVWVGFTFLTHVVGRSFTVVESTNGNLSDLVWVDVNPNRNWKGKFMMLSYNVVPNLSPCAQHFTKP